MSRKVVIVGQNLQEEIEYPNHSFPISFYEDHLDDYLNGEMGYHWHEEFEFGMLLRGQVRCFIGHGAAEPECGILTAGDGLFVNSKSLHRIVQEEPGTVLYNFVLPAGFFGLLPMGEAHQKCILPVTRSSAAGLFLHREEERDKPLLDCMEDIYGMPQEEMGYELHCMELVCRLWRRLFIRISDMEEPSAFRAGELKEQRLRRMLSFLHAHFGEEISVNSVAAAANISRSECFRCFRAVIGKTPSEYLNQYRLSQAAYFLSYTERPLSDICFSCGFKSMSYFGKCFRETYGMSPGQYRKNGVRAGRQI